jgi:hypothetical protein
MIKDFAFTPAPAPALDGYATCKAECMVNIPADQFFDWYMLEPLENFMLGTLIVPPIIATMACPGPAWGRAGSARKIFFKDGTVALERILTTNLPHSYFYQPWAYTNPVRLMSDYATSTMSVIDEGGKTRIVWDYGFHARYAVLKPFLQAFVSLDWKRNLQNGLKIIKAHLDVHGTSKRIHEVQKAA